MAGYGGCLVKAKTVNNGNQCNDIEVNNYKIYQMREMYLVTASDQIKME